MRGRVVLHASYRGSTPSKMYSDSGSDYVSVAQLRFFLTQLDPLALVCLDATSARYYRLRFSHDQQTEDGPQERPFAGWNSVDFASSACSTRQDLLRLVDELHGSNPYAGITLGMRMVRLPWTGNVRLPTASLGLYKDTLLNPYRYAERMTGVLAAGHGSHPERVYEQLLERYGAEVADGIALHLVADSWHTTAGLHRRFPKLASQAGWERLFAPCRRGSLRRCVADALDAVMGVADTLVEHLMRHHRTPSEAGGSPTRTTPTTPTPAATAQDATASSAPCPLHAAAAPSVGAVPVEEHRLALDRGDYGRALRLPSGCDPMPTVSTTTAATATATATATMSIASRLQTMGVNDPGATQPAGRDSDSRLAEPERLIGQGTMPAAASMVEEGANAPVATASGAVTESLATAGAAPVRAAHPGWRSPLSEEEFIEMVGGSVW